MNAKALAEAKGRWADVVLTDAALSHFQVRLGAVLVLRHTNRDHFFSTGELLAWPSQKLLAKETASTEDGVRKAIRELCARGLIVIRRAGCGRTLNTQYRLIAQQHVRLAAQQTLNEEGALSVGGFSAKPSTTIPERPDGCPEKASTATTTTFLKNLDEHIQGSARGPNAFDRLVSIMPDRMVKISNLVRARATWGPKVAVRGIDAVLGAASAYASDPIIAKQNHLPSLQKWLVEDLFEQFLAEAPSPARALSWAGPPEIREALVAEPGCGDAFAGSYLDPSAWEPVGRHIIPRTTVARDALRRRSALWTRLEITISEPAASVAKAQS